MRKLILILAIFLISSPAFAALSVYLEREGITNVVDVKYSGADIANLPRAFALVIKTNCQALIHDVNNFKLDGESTAASPGYGIYPARIFIDTAGTVTSYGTPLADSTDPVPGDGLDSNSVVLEFGSLYSGDANAPAASGTLCKLYINLNGRTTDFILTMTDEATYRGGVVLEDGTKVEVNSTLILGCLSLPGAVTNPSPANMATCVSIIQDLNWTSGIYGCGITPSHDVYFGTANPPPCQGNQTATTFDTGTMANNTTYYWRIDEVSPGGTTMGDIWRFTTVQAAPGPATNPNPANGATDIPRIGTSLSWTAGSGTVDSHDVYFGTTNPPTFKVNQTATSYATGTMGQGKLYYWRIDEKNTGATTPGDVWNFRVEECVKSTAPFYGAWVGAGKPWSRPDCWCCQRNCRGDADCLRQLNLYWVLTADLAILRSAFALPDAQLNQVKICADFDHKKQLNTFRVYTADLTILSRYYATTQSNVPICPMDWDGDGNNDYNFWTN